MLVGKRDLSKPKKPRLYSDAGSTMVTVMVVMLVLAIGSMAIVSLAMRTSVNVSNTNDRSAAQAEVDGGVTRQVTALMNQEIICDPTVLGPDGGQLEAGQAIGGTVLNGAGSVGVNWTVTCLESGALDDRNAVATIKADSKVGRETVSREATLNYVPYRHFYSVEGLVFYKGADLTSGTRVGSPTSPVNLVIPDNGLDCQAEIWGTVTVFGPLIMRQGCQIHGQVNIATGSLDMKSGATINGGLLLSDNNSGSIQGTVVGTVWSHGPVTVSGTIQGNLMVRGDVAVSGKVTGKVTVPKGNAVTGGGAVGSIEQVDPLVLPAFAGAPPWYDFTLDWERDWKAKDFSLLKVTRGGNGMRACSGWESGRGAGWAGLASLPEKTVVDARDCKPLNASSASVNVAHDVLIVGNGVNLQKSTWSAASSVPASTLPKIWFVTEDTVPDSVPTCAGNQSASDLFKVNLTSKVVGMIYTPCQVKMGSGSVPWRGSIYSGDFDNGANMNFEYGDICLPGLCDEDRQDSITGDLTEMRDVKLHTSRPTS